MNSNYVTSFRVLMLAMAIASFLLACQLAGAAETEYKFNNLGEAPFSNEKTNLTFKAASDANSGQADPVAGLQSQQAFSGFVGYPRYAVDIGFAPTNLGFRQDYNGLPFNFASTSYDNLKLAGRMIFSPHFEFELRLSHSSVSVGTKDLGTYQVEKSTADMNGLIGKFNYCEIYDHPDNKLCYGIGVGSDSFSSLRFTTPTSLRVATISDLVAVFSIGFSRTLSPFYSLHSNFEYGLGLRSGQNSNLGVDDDKAMKLQIDVHKQNQNNLNYWSAGMGYETRDAKIHGSTGNFSDNWTARTSGYALRLGYTWILEQN